MVKKIVIFALAFTFKINAQVNLVPNPSFESYSVCPSGDGQIYLSTDWEIFRESPDYFNSCATNSALQVPANQYGNQIAFSGSAYCGIISFNNSIFSREIFGAQLISPLVSSQKYYITFRLNQPDDLNFVRYSIDKLGVRFTTYRPDLNQVPINNWAHVTYTNVINDNLNWTTVSSTFTSDSNYNFILIGNFYDDSNISILDNGGTAAWSYYYIDDICVSTDQLLCNEATYVDKFFGHGDQLNVFPNPVDAFLNIPLSVQNISIHDIFGSEVKTEMSKGLNFYQLNCNYLKDGVYVLKSNSIIKKIIIQHEK